jgi:hypothetical protein
LIVRLDRRDLWQGFGVGDDRPPVLASDRDAGGVGRGYEQPDSRATTYALKRKVRERITALVADFAGADESSHHKVFDSGAAIIAIGSPCQVAISRSIPTNKSLDFST